jgi:hypothetical protein
VLTTETARPELHLQAQLVTDPLSEGLPKGCTNGKHKCCLLFPALWDMSTAAEKIVPSEESPARASSPFALASGHQFKFYTVLSCCLQCFWTGQLKLTCTTNIQVTSPGGVQVGECI